MRKLPDKLRDPYVAALRMEPLTQGEAADYQKWLRFYLDFCCTDDVFLSVDEEKSELNLNLPVKLLVTGLLGPGSQYLVSLTVVWSSLGVRVPQWLIELLTEPVMGS